MIIVLILIVSLFLLYLLSLMGRPDHPGLEALKGWSYAHRGLHGNGIPENSMEAFRLALEGGYGIELDVHLLRDGELAVIHDAKLIRTTGADGCIEDLSAEDVANYRLEGTDETIPLFHQVLDLYQGKAPLIVELKPEKGNHAALCQAVCDMLEGYEGVYCLESFDPRCVAWLKKNRPQLIRGQLTENFLINKKSPLPVYLKWVLTWQILNFLTRPDFIAYQFADRKHFSVSLCRHIWGLQGVTWTLKTPEDHAQAVKEGWIPIFEGYRP